MLFRPIKIFILCICSVAEVGAQTSAHVDLSESGNPIVLPRMDSLQRRAINVSGPDDGLLVYDTDLKSVSFYDGVFSKWIALKGADGRDGLSGANGANGPQGPRGMARAGAAGPDGTAMVTMLHCWDRDMDQIADPEDDVNNDSLWNTLDCAGDKGAQGLSGITPAPMPFSINYTHVTAEGTNESTLSNGALSSTSKVFVHSVDFVTPIFTEFAGASTWRIKTTDSSTIPIGTSFKIIIVN